METMQNFNQIKESMIVMLWSLCIRRRCVQRPCAACLLFSGVSKVESLELQQLISSVKKNGYLHAHEEESIALCETKADVEKGLHDFISLTTSLHP